MMMMMMMLVVVMMVLMLVKPQSLEFFRTPDCGTYLARRAE